MVPKRSALKSHQSSLMLNLTFLGAARTVTGSKYLLTNNKLNCLIDCGLFQGMKMLRLKNWDPFVISPKSIDSVVLTHAHIDHSGYLPLLVRQGFQGKIFCTPSTEALCQILLPDSARLQEEEAEYANRKGFSKHHPALPLYNEKDAEIALKHFFAIEFHKPFELSPGVMASLIPAGHILGAASVYIDCEGRRLCFTGDLGREKDLVMNPPETCEEADYLVVESTYGSRIHEVEDPLKILEEVIIRTAERGGVVLIPSFAVGRAQLLLYALYRLKKESRIPDIPVFLNSPMAEDATGVFCRFQGEHRLNPEDSKGACESAHYIHSIEESKGLNKKSGPMILIASSGMLTGGRVLHHLKAFGGDKKNTIVFTGYQAMGTRGEALIRGSKSVKIHGEMVPIEAEIVQMDSLSAHADQREILNWLSKFKKRPKKTFLVHGETEASVILKALIEKELGWNCYIPELMEKVVLV